MEGATWISPAAQAGGLIMSERSGSWTTILDQEIWNDVHPMSLVLGLPHHLHTAPTKFINAILSKTLTSPF